MKRVLLALCLIATSIYVQKSNAPVDLRILKSDKIFEILQNDDTLVLNYSSSGCFHLAVEKIIFTKNTEVVKAEIFIKDKLVKSQVLTAKMIKFMIAFENKARLMNKNAGCTTSETYTFMLNNIPQFSIVDSTCSWNGYDLLKKEIFNIGSI